MEFITSSTVAIIVRRRKARNPVILKVRAKEAHKNGVAFYLGNQKVWLADTVPALLIELS